MSNMKRFLAVFVMVGTMFFVGCGNGAEEADDANTDEDEEEMVEKIDEEEVEVTIEFGHKMPNDSPEGQAFLKFGELVAEKSDGRIGVQIYPSEQLGTGLTQIDNVAMGAQDAYADDSTYFSGHVKDFNVATIPYLFEDFDHYHEFWMSDMGQEIEDELVDQGMRILNEDRNFVRGPYRVICATEPITSLEDVQGLDLRAFESDVYVQAWDELGANPTVVAWTETYLGIDQGTVEAVTSPISLVRSMAFHEVAPYITAIDEHPQDIVIVINEDIFQGFSEEDQEILIEAANEAGDYGTKLAEEVAEEDIEVMKEQGAEYYGMDEIDTEPFAEKLEDFYLGLEEEGFLSEGVVDKILELADY